ncbi:MAG: fibronectin type III domain-containing protein [Methanoregula sp.]
MKNNFLVLVIICFSLCLTSGFLWTIADAGNTANMVITARSSLVGYNISATGIGTDNATITWKTNGDANSAVEYGTTTGYGSTRTSEMTELSHTIHMSGLSSGAVYHYRVMSTADDGASMTSADASFKTLNPSGTTVSYGILGTTFPGISPGTGAGVRNVILDLSAISGTTQISGNTVTISHPGNGWSTLQATGTRVTSNGETTRIDNIQGVVMESIPVTANLGGNIGTVSTSLNVAQTQLVSGAVIGQNVIQGASTSAADAFQLAAAARDLTIVSVAYTVEFLNTGPLNANMGPDGVTVKLSIDHAWVVANAPDGDRNNIRIIRFSEDGTKEVLTTQYTGSQGSTDYFRAASHGFSVFGMVAVAAAHSGGAGWSSDSGGGDSGSFTIANSPLTVIQQLAPPAEASNTPVERSGPLTSVPLTADLVGLPGVSVTWATRINDNPVTDAYITTAIQQDTTPSTLNAFITALHLAGQDIGNLAYVMIVQKTGLISTGPATITMTIPQDWVTRNGGTDAIRIVRMGDDGTSEVLQTSFVGYDSDSSYLIFRAASPKGLSTFGLVAVKSYMLAPMPTSDLVTPTQAPVTPFTKPSTGLPLMGIAGVIAAAMVIIIGVALLRFRRRNT